MGKINVFLKCNFVKNPWAQQNFKICMWEHTVFTSSCVIKYLCQNQPIYQSIAENIFVCFWRNWEVWTAAAGHVHLNPRWLWNDSIVHFYLLWVCLASYHLMCIAPEIFQKFSQERTQLGNRGFILEIRRELTIARKWIFQQQGVDGEREEETRRHSLCSPPTRTHTDETLVLGRHTVRNRLRQNSWISN